jgi:FkbM family methyltransferase
MSNRWYRLKEILRDALPTKYQVPIKFQYNSFRNYLEPEIAILGGLVKPGEIVVDVGANRGLYTYYFWKLGCAVKAFEPNLNCLIPLKAWAVGKDQVSIYDSALSDTDSRADLFVPIDGTGVEHDSSASLERPEDGMFRRRGVDLRTMDSFGFADVSLIKIDVEGHEQNVLEGASKTIESSNPALLIEIEQRHGHADVREKFRSIESRGYKGFFLKNGKLNKIEGFDPAVDQNLSNFGQRRSIYINNFIFLAAPKLEARAYESFFQKVG